MLDDTKLSLFTAKLNQQVCDLGHAIVFRMDQVRDFFGDKDLPENLDRELALQLMHAIKAFKPKRIRKKKINEVDQLKIAFWFIAKMGNIEQAERIFGAAKQAYKALHE